MCQIQIMGMSEYVLIADFLWYIKKRKLTRTSTGKFYPALHNSRWYKSLDEILNLILLFTLVTLLTIVTLVKFLTLFREAILKKKICSYLDIVKIALTHPPVFLDTNEELFFGRNVQS